MIDLSHFEVWFVTGSQHLYGDEVIRKVESHSREISSFLNGSSLIPVSVRFKTVATTSESILDVCRSANIDKKCVGLIFWMHTFSPAKMWISGLTALNKPFVHFHTQYNRDIPWSEIDMNFMNLHQSAHGDREFGFITSRLKCARKVVTGYWQDVLVIQKLAIWTRVACAVHDSRAGRIARIGDNMRDVAVTEGDKVEAQRVFGYSVNGYGLGDVHEHIKQVTNSEIKSLIEQYEQDYDLSEALRSGGPKRGSLIEAARIEAGLRSFLIAGNFTAFTDTFENLYGLHQLPGIGVQRLMAEGYGFGAEGDWKTASLVRAMKVMASGLHGGNSFMEDYTYHLEAGNELVLGSHMLEICPSIASFKPKCEIHPLSIGGKEDPVRLVFDTSPGDALNASIVDTGHRFRLLVNTLESVMAPAALPKLPVGRVIWKTHPTLKISATAWILAGGGHHTCFSQNLTTEYLEDFAEMFQIECLVVDKATDLRSFRNELRWNDAAFQ